MAQPQTRVDYLRPDTLGLVEIVSTLPEVQGSRDEQIGRVVSRLRSEFEGFSLSLVLMDEQSLGAAVILQSLVNAGIGSHDRLTALIHRPLTRNTPMELGNAVFDGEFSEMPRRRYVEPASNLTLENFDVVILGCEIPQELEAALTIGRCASLYLLNQNGPEFTVTERLIQEREVNQQF